VVVERAEVDPLDRDRGVVPDTMVAGFLDGVGVVAGALDDPRVDPVAVWRALLGSQVPSAAGPASIRCVRVFPLPLGLTSTNR
jgi:hypothetical protein